MIATSDSRERRRRLAGRVLLAALALSGACQAANAASPDASPISVVIDPGAGRASLAEIAVVGAGVGAVLMLFMLAGGAIFATLSRTARPVVYRLEISRGSGCLLGQIQIVDGRAPAEPVAAPIAEPHRLEGKDPEDHVPFPQTVHPTANSADDALMTHLFRKNLELQDAIFRRNDSAA